MSSAHHRVSVKLAEALHVSDPRIVFFRVLTSLEVRVLVTILNAVTKLSAAKAPRILQLLQLLHFFVGRVVVLLIRVVVLGLVFRELAAGLVLTPLSATPPHFTAPLGLVHAAGPVEILLFIELLLALLAGFESLVELTFPLQKLSHILLQFIPFVGNYLFFLLNR